jgi:hypothetical protein
MYIIFGAFLESMSAASLQLRRLSSAVTAHPSYSEGPGKNLGQRIS